MLTAAGMATGERVRVFGRAADLPGAWDDLAASALQRRDLLAHAERTNPCGQRYHVLDEDGVPTAGAVVYSTVQNLLTFLGNLPSPVRLNVVGLPVSVAPPGVVGADAPVRRLLARIFAAEPGLTVALNLEPGVRVPGTLPLRMLPDMVLDNRFGSVAAYRRALRSAWRRRLDRTRARFRGVEVERSGCAAYTAAHHRLYLQVLARAPERLETLAPAFFRGLPAPFELVSCRADGRLLCWRLMLSEHGRTSFVLGGHDYDLNERYGSYFNTLLGVLEEGLAAGARRIAFGQTAEDPKARLGARPVEKIMLLAHRNRLAHGLVRAVSPLVACRRRPPGYRVFRPDGGEVGP